MTPELLTMQLDCVRHAAKGISLADYRLFASRSTQALMSYQDRIRVLDSLIDEGIIRIVNHTLDLGVLGMSESLTQQLAVGDQTAWEIVDTFPERSWKFDPDQAVLATIGLNGELAVLDALHSQIEPDLNHRICHVSLTNDALGFDIATPSTHVSELTNFLEVKTTTRPGRKFRFHLTRNEFEVGRRSERWFIVFVQLQATGSAQFGYLSFQEIDGLTPAERSQNFKWESCACTVSIDDLNVGLP